MISYYLRDEEMTRYIERLKAGVDALNPQSQKLLNFLFFRTDEKGEPDYDWDVGVANFRRNKKGGEWRVRASGLRAHRWCERGPACLS